MSANAPHVIAGPLTGEQPGYDLDQWLDESAPPDLLRPVVLLVALVVLIVLLCALGAVLIGTA